MIEIFNKILDKQSYSDYYGIEVIGCHCTKEKRNILIF